MSLYADPIIFAKLDNISPPYPLPDVMLTVTPTVEL
jgi:hypothetical protein